MAGDRLPLASVVAGVGTVVVATRSGGADVVRDVRQDRRSRPPTRPRRQARKLGLSACCAPTKACCG